MVRIPETPQTKTSITVLESSDEFETAAAAVRARAKAPGLAAKLSFIAAAVHDEGYKPTQTIIGRDAEREVNIALNAACSRRDVVGVLARVMLEDAESKEQTVKITLEDTVEGSPQTIAELIEQGGPVFAATSGEPREAGGTGGYVVEAEFLNDEVRRIPRIILDAA